MPILSYLFAILSPLQTNKQDIEWISDKRVGKVRYVTTKGVKYDSRSGDICSLGVLPCAQNEIWYLRIGKSDLVGKRQCFGFD